MMLVFSREIGASASAKNQSIRSKSPLRLIDWRSSSASASEIRIVAIQTSSWNRRPRKQFILGTDRCLRGRRRICVFCLANRRRRRVRSDYRHSIFQDVFATTTITIRARRCVFNHTSQAEAEAEIHSEANGAQS